MFQNLIKVQICYFRMILQFKLFLKMTQTINTVSVYRSLLQEDDYEMKEIAVQQLLNNINLHWTDIANDINIIQELMDDTNFPNRELVAILLSKIYFYLNDYDEALRYALQSGKYFDFSGFHTDFVEILINKGIQKYIQCCQQQIQDPEQNEYKKIVDVAIENSIGKNDLKLPLGIALDTKDIDLFRRVVSLMSTQDLIQNITSHLFRVSGDFKKAMLEVMTEKISFSETFTPQQYINILQILYSKGDYSTVSKIIYECLRNNRKQIAYTLALQVSQMHGFNKNVLASIPIETQMEGQRKVLQTILEGKLLDDVHNIVLKNLAKTDPHYQAILKKIEHKNSISHGSAIMGLSMLQAYTQDDSFLQKEQNLQWAGKCTHWNKFSSIASIGLIFKNNKNKDQFSKFLPGSGNADLANQYPNGGSLYGLGLLYTGTSNQDIIDYIIEVTTNPSHNQNEVVMHGACLGLGLTAFASANQMIGERLKDILHSSTSIMGEASALAIGLTFAGTNNESILSDLIGFAQDTQHEKTLRSICLAIGIISFGYPSMDFLQNLQANANLKLAVPTYLACAYFKSSNPVIVRKLLKLSNDISNQVKRTSLIALGFVMYHDEKLIDIVKMLLYSYNPFIRYGCVMALAIGCKDNKDAIQLIWPLLSDSADFVRQGVYIALAILFQVSTNNSEPKLEEFRKNISEILGKSHVQVMAKMGAILSVGILDIGGRNMNISLTTRSGIPKIQAITGLLVFSQYWNWFSYSNFIGLALTPSCFIGVTADMKIPKSFQLKSNCRPSLFDYPANIVVEEKKNQNKKEQAKQLSTTNKAKVRAALKKKESDMDIEPPSNMVKKPSLISVVEDKKGAQKVEEKQKQKQVQKIAEKKEEETFSILNNPVRISEKQKKYMSFVQGRYTPVLKDRYIGINFLYDSSPSESDDYYSLVKEQSKMDIEKPLEQIPELPQEQVPPPEDFEYDESKQLLNKKND